MAALTVTYKVLSTQTQPIYFHFTSHIKRIYLNSMVHSSVFFLHIDVENLISSSYMLPTKPNVLVKMSLHWHVELLNKRSNGLILLSKRLAMRSMT